MEFHKSETFQFGNVNPTKDSTVANTDDSNGPPEETFNSSVHEKDQELGKAKEKIPAEQKQQSSSMIR